MSHEILKSISIDKETNKAIYLQKSNNDTAPFRQGETPITNFFHNLIGNVFQTKSPKINQIVKEYEYNISQMGYSVDDIWWSIERGDIDSLKSEIRESFFRCCDKIRNL